MRTCVRMKSAAKRLIVFFEPIGVDEPRGIVAGVREDGVQQCGFVAHGVEMIPEATESVGEVEIFTCLNLLLAAIVGRNNTFSLRLCHERA